MSDADVIEVGLGEVGRPIFDILHQSYECIAIVVIGPV